MKIFLLLFSVIGILPLCAGLKYEKENISAEAGLDDKTISRDFKFTNESDAAVTIRAADAGCSCISVQIAGGKMTYAPGETGTMRANFEIGSFQGTVEKPIYVWLDGDPDESPSSTVRLSVTIPTIISLEPKTVKWRIGDNAASKVIDVKMAYKKQIHITELASNNENFKVKLITVEDGKHYQIEVSPQDMEAPGLCVIRIKTDVDVSKQRIQQVFAVIAAPLKKLP
ncbi:MAG: DUF1573 domain-containing protein [Luteolibacter sp.]